MDYMVKIGDAKAQVKKYSHFILTVHCVGGQIVTDLDISDAEELLPQFAASVNEIFNLGMGIVGISHDGQIEFWKDVKLQAQFLNAHGIHSPKVLDMFKLNAHTVREQICLSIELRFFDEAGIEHDVMVYKKIEV